MPPPVSPICTPPPHSRCRNDKSCTHDHSPADSNRDSKLDPNQDGEAKGQDNSIHEGTQSDIHESPLKCDNGGTGNAKPSQISAWDVLLKRQPIGQAPALGGKGKFASKCSTFHSPSFKSSPNTPSSPASNRDSRSLKSQLSSSSQSSQGVGGGPLETSDSPVCMSKETEDAMLGISLIWVHGRHRRKGLGRRLLDAAREGFVYGCEIPSNKVAFSLPTRDGSLLARSYFGHPRFLVYPPTLSSST
mmetsp:Transcript_45353/g.120618  ORF Transcript_45353/g.120618 Transcript_45353/m.120618 type:complete len:246 (+) Transcript_45353:1238-1975(+)